jgi:phi13 family phage major tail protein
MNFISVDSLYYAVMTGDTASAVNYSVVKPFAPAAKISVDPSVNVQTFYADGVAQENAQIMGEGKVSVDISTVALSVQADVLGHTLDGTGGIVYNKNDQAPYVALFYRRLKANGHYRYIKVLKCKFVDPKDDAETESNNVKIQNDVISGTFYPRIYDGNWKKVKDQDEPGYVDVSTTWFTAVDSADVTPPTVASTVPANNATAVAVGTTYQWVFSESIAPSTVLANNFFLIKDSDGSIVGATVAYNDTTKTVTLTPTVALSAASKYLAVADNDVTDLSGNHLAAVTKIFTTA